MWASTLWDNGLIPLQWGAVICASLIAALTDAAERRIPNLLTGVVFGAGVIYALCVGGPAGLADGLTAAAAIALPYVVLFIFAGGGAGDAKLMASLGMWLGLVNGTAVLAAVCLCGIILAVLKAVSRKRFRALLMSLAVLAAGALYFLAARGRVKTPPERPAPGPEAVTIPYGIAIFAGVCVAAAGVLIWRTQ